MEGRLPVLPLSVRGKTHPATKVRKSRRAERVEGDGGGASAHRGRTQITVTCAQLAAD